MHKHGPASYMTSLDSPGKEGKEGKFFLFKVDPISKEANPSSEAMQESKQEATNVASNVKNRDQNIIYSQSPKTKCGQGITSINRDGKSTIIPRRKSKVLEKSETLPLIFYPQTNSPQYFFIYIMCPRLW